MISPVCGIPDPTWDFSFLNRHPQFVDEMILTLDPADSIGFEEAGTLGYLTAIWDWDIDSLGDSLTFFPLNAGGMGTGIIDTGFYFELGGLMGTQFPQNLYNHKVTIHWESLAGGSVVDSGMLFLIPTIFQAQCSSIADTVVLDAPPGGASTISLTTNQQLSFHMIYIKNDTSVWINPELLAIADTNSYAYFNSAGTETVAMHDLILPGDTSINTPIVLTLDVPDTGTYTIDMALTYKAASALRKTEITSIPAYNYPVVVHRVPAGEASVSELSQASADFTINPNPARGEVAITVPLDINSTIQIYDVLGNLMMSRQVNGPFVWDGETTMGEIIPNGAYIVRVREVSGSGEVSGASKELLYMR